MSSVVLVVDDDPAIRELISVNLSEAGHAVVTASNGREALQAARAERPAAIVLDLMMPGVDGWDVLAELKAKGSSDLANVPVVMVTGRTDAETKIRSGIEGALVFVRKPFGPSDIIEAIERVLAPDSPSEEQQRKQVRAASLEALARYERTGEDVAADAGPRVRLTRLENTPTGFSQSPRAGAARARVHQLTPRQRELLRALATGKPVSHVAEELGMSRSNVYTSLRRIGRRLGLDGTSELLGMARQGAFGDL